MSVDSTTMEQRQLGAALYPWMAKAWSQFGAHERPGPEGDPMIAEWAKDAGIVDFNEDVDAYCALFPRWCIKQALPEEKLPPNPKWSKGWLKFGKAIEPWLGAVAVFYRGRPEQDIGHVAFVLGQLEESLVVLGANQSNSVSVVEMPRRRLLGCRWPLTWQVE